MGERTTRTTLSDSSGRADSGASLTPQRWQKVKELFGLALDREPSQRKVFLEEACIGDESLLAEVESLLASADGAGSATSRLFHVVSPYVEDPPGETEDEMLGRRIGDYCIVRRIGYGGMAVVYLASRADDQFRMEVAVKMLRPDLDRTQLLRRFLQERQTLAALDHPNIVKLLDGGSTEEGLPYLVMDYVEGSPIDEYCDTHNLSVQNRLRLFDKVCEAVEYAHGHRVIHRDLKPNNILVAADGTPKLLDFGISKVLDQAAATESTQTAHRHLTPAYASPEQVRGEAVTSSSDVYSLGVVLYRLLTGHRPYKLRQCTPAAVERAICEQDPESPSTAVDRVEIETKPDGTTATIAAEDVSRTREGQPDKLRRALRGDLDNIVLKALQKDPRRRYGSAAELADDIQRHLEHRPIKARSNTLLYRTSKFVRRHKTETIAAAVVVLVLAGAVGYSVWAEQHAAARARAELVSQRARGRRSIAVLGFKNLSTRADTAWLSIALSEMLTTELSLGGKLRTIPGESVAQTKLNLSLPELDALSQKTLSRVYKNLDSDLVVLGSYLAVADPNRTVRLDLRVQDAALGETVASMALNGSENSLPDLIARTGAELREKLGVSRISPEEAASVQASLPSNPEAARMYAEGLARLRAFDALGAKEWLSKAATADPKNPLPHSALADAMSQLGYEKAAIDESRKAFDLAANLTREQSLEIQGRYYRLTKDLGKAIQTYRALFVFFPDNVDYGLQLASSLTDAGKHQDSLKIFKALHELPPPASSDPRIDLAEAEAYSSSSLQEQERVASRAAANADALGAKWLAGRARIIQGRALKNLGQLDPAILILLRAKQLLSDVGDRLGEAKASHFLGQVYEDQGEFEEGRKALEESIRLLQSMSNRVGQTGVWNDLSTVLERENNLSQAKLALQQALTIAREYDDQNQLPVILTNMAVLETLEGDLQVAQNHLAEALAISRETADRVQTSEILNNLAPVLRAEGKSTEAGKLLEESSQISRDTGMKTALCDALIGLGDLHLDRLEPVRARRLYSEALEVSTLAKSDIYASSALSGLGEVSAAQGDLSQARKYNERALDLRMHIGDGEYLALSHMSLAELSLDEGSVSAAESMARQAINEFGAQNDVDDQAQAMAVLARSLIMQGKNAEGRQVIATAKGRAEKTADHPTRISVSIADAYSQVASGDALKAARALRAAISEARNSGYGQLQLEARLALGEALNKAGNSAAAKAELESLEHDARAKGFVFIAGKAHSARG